MAKQDLLEVLEKFQINDRVRHSLAAFWPTVENKLPDIMEQFYATVGGWSETKPLLNGKSLDLLKTNQADHWRRLFNDVEDPDYMDTAITIGQVHAHIGLRLPEWVTLEKALPLSPPR